MGHQRPASDTPSKWSTCADPKRFVRGGQNVTFFFSSCEDPNTTISGPLSAHQQNAIKIAFRWRADNGQTLNAGSVAL